MMIWTGTGVLIPDLQTDTLRSRPEENMFWETVPKQKKWLCPNFLLKNAPKVPYFEELNP